MSKSFKEDLTGKRFGRLTVLEFVPNEKAKSYWKCRCDCGNIRIIQGTALKNGNTKSCGCYHSEVSAKRREKHKLTHTRLYSVWNRMKQRCYNSNDKCYKGYGARGIKVCDEWRQDFKAFYDWAIANKYKSGLSIDRIDVNGNYEPDNCRWVDMKTQARNRRNNVLVEYEGEMMTLGEIAEQINIPYATLKTRYQNGDRGDKLFRTTKKRQ